jgi:flagellar protein FlbD
MIQLTRLNNHLLVVNSDLIKFIERAPDTVLTLITGEKVVVSEPVEVILEKITEFRRSIQGPAKPLAFDTYATAEPADERGRDLG